MTDTYHTYFTDQPSLDQLSITELEQLLDLEPYSVLHRMLLAKKMSTIEGQDLMLRTGDRLSVHYLLNGKSDPFQDSLGAEIPDSYDENFVSVHNEPNEDAELIVRDKIRDAENFPTMNALEQTDPSDNTETEGIHSIILRKDSDSGTTEFPIGENTEIEEMISKKKNQSPSKKKKQKKFKLKEYSGISDFSKWLLSFRHDDVEKQILKEEKAAKKRLLEESAKKSVTKSASIISEPLAEILASQGHLDDAKKMYEQLIAKFPEKSSYFAVKINELIKI